MINFVTESKLIMTMTTEELDYEIKRLKSMKAITARQKRSDIGKERAPYHSKLPLQYRSYMNRANKKGLSFTLTVEEFQSITNKPCVYCGTYAKIGIDRYDSSIGYDFENCQACCGKCNMMKFTHNHEDFINQIKKIHSHINR